MTLGLVGALVALALVDSTSFGTLGIPVFLVVAGEARTVPRRVLLYLATISAFYFLVGVALMLGLSTVVDLLGDALYSDTAYWIQVGVGIALVLASYPLDPKWRAKRGLPVRRFEPRIGGPRVMVGLALTAGLVEVATMVPYLAAIGLLTTADLPPVLWLVLLSGYVLVMVLPALVLLLLRRLMAPALERLRGWLARHAASGMSWALAIVGVLLVLNALGVLFAPEA